MKKEYIIGGLLGVVLCGVVAYAVMTFIGMESSETAQQLAEKLPSPVPLGVAVLETRQPAKDPLPDQGKATNITPTSGLSDGRRTDELKAEGRTGVKITLKNGRSIIADSCRDVSGKLLCIVSGGSMQIDRQEIASIKDVKLQSISSSDRTAEPSDGKADDRKAADNASAGAKGAQPSDGKLVRGLTAEQIKRLDQITERKAVLQPERERLIKEREQLHEDVKNMGMIRKQEQYDDLKKRIADLEARINSFNDEGKKLNEEEKAIMDSSAVR
jgi:hypothetical protein